MPMVTGDRLAWPDLATSCGTKLPWRNVHSSSSSVLLLAADAGVQVNAMLQVVGLLRQPAGKAQPCGGIRRRQDVEIHATGL